MLIQLVYVSSAARLMSRQELFELLDQSRRNNQRQDITGMLLYKDGNFMQALEGPEEAVNALHAKIQADPRHKGMITLFERPAERREFGDWSMGFQNLDELDLSGVPGYTEFLNEPLSSQGFQESGKAMKLLTLFRQNMR